MLTFHSNPLVLVNEIEELKKHHSVMAETFGVYFESRETQVGMIMHAVRTSQEVDPSALRLTGK
jgi:hypothetical protein